MAFLQKSKELQWTYHARAKMRFYKLSEQRVRRVIYSPKRIEEGIAPKTIAMMQPSSVKTTKGKARSGKRQETWSQEIWVMVQHANSAPSRSLRSRFGNAKAPMRITKVISAWRYPGMTKPGDPLPEEILRELKNLL